MDLGKHIAFYQLELAQLWRCPVMWCTVWKGTAQDCIDNMRRTHRLPLSVKAANLAQILSSVDSHQGPVVQNVNARCLRRGD